MALERIIVLSCVIMSVQSHVVADKTQLTALKALCEHAYSCFHDKVIVCGKSVNEARTFIDLCDMYEYSCEYVMVFRHVKDDEYCPNEKDLAFYNQLYIKTIDTTNFKQYQVSHR